MENFAQPNKESESTIRSRWQQKQEKLRLVEQSKNKIEGEKKLTENQIEVDAEGMKQLPRQDINGKETGAIFKTRKRKHTLGHEQEIKRLKQHHEEETTSLKEELEVQKIKHCEETQQLQQKHQKEKENMAQIFKDGYMLHCQEKKSIAKQHRQDKSCFYQEKECLTEQLKILMEGLEIEKKCNRDEKESTTYQNKIVEEKHEEERKDLEELLKREKERGAMEKKNMLYVINHQKGQYRDQAQLHKEEKVLFRKNMYEQQHHHED